MGLVELVKTLENKEANKTITEAEAIILKKCYDLQTRIIHSKTETEQKEILETIKEIQAEYETETNNNNNKLKQLFEPQKTELRILNTVKINNFVSIEKIETTNTSKIKTMFLRLKYNNSTTYYSLNLKSYKENKEQAIKRTLTNLLTDLYYYNNSIALNTYKNSFKKIIEILQTDKNKNGIVTENIEYYKEVQQNTERLEEIKQTVEDKFNKSASYTEETRIRELSKLIINSLQIVKDTDNNYYYLDTEKQIYKLLDNETIDNELKKLFTTDNLISTKQVTKSLDYLKTYVKRSKHLISFKNCLFNTKENIIETETEKGILPYVEIPYNLNLNPILERNKETKQLKNKNYAEVENFLHTTFAEDKSSFLEMLGYLIFEVGNPNEIFIFLTGIAGAGKTTVTNIIQGILPSTTRNTGNFFNNRFGKSNIENKRICIFSDVETNNIKNIKNYIGSEFVEIEKKGKDLKVIEQDFLPILFFNCNLIPNFNLEKAIQDKILIFHLKHIFRFANNNKNKDIKNYSKIFLENAEATEYLIYLSHKQYYKKDKTEPFKIQKKTEENLYKNSKQGNLYYILSDIVYYKYSNTIKEAEINEAEAIEVKTEDLNKIIKNYAKYNRLTVDLTPKGKIKNLAKFLKDFTEDYNYTSTKGQGNYKIYPNLEYKYCKIIDAETNEVKHEKILSNEFYLNLK